MDVAWVSSRRYEAGAVTVLELHGDLVAGTVLKLQPTVAGPLAGLDHLLALDLHHVRNADTTGATMLAAPAKEAYAPPACSARRCAHMLILMVRGCARDATRWSR